MAKWVSTSSDIDRLGMLTARVNGVQASGSRTGLHALGWSRRGIDWLLGWAPIGRLTVEQEVDATSARPGPLLQTGQLEIMRLRADAGGPTRPHFAWPTTTSCSSAGSGPALLREGVGRLDPLSSLTDSTRTRSRSRVSVRVDLDRVVGGDRHGSGPEDFHGADPSDETG